MISKRAVCALALGLALVGAGLPAAAEVKITVEISGTIEEILPILQMLQQSGLEKAAAEQLQGLKLEIQSTATQAGQAATAPAPEAPPAPPAEPPQPAFTGVVIEKPIAKPGDQVLISVQVNDPQKQVDTVAARTADSGTYAFDLFDNGAQGDPTPSDGTWSYRYTIPADAPAGEMRFQIIAFDANAEPVKVKSESGEPVPLTTEAVITVQP